jgi:hypothetical protein
MDAWRDWDVPIPVMIVIPVMTLISKNERHFVVNDVNAILLAIPDECGGEP